MIAPLALVSSGIFAGEPAFEVELAASAAAPAPVHVDREADGSVWARGATYKARFARGSASYVPFFGSSAPVSHPLALTLRDVTFGGAALAFARDAEPVATASSVSFDRGTLVERYELRERSIEQIFELSTLPSHGDLVLRLDVDTDLAAVDADVGLRFANELGHVSFGDGIAYDARGSCVELESRLEDGAIVLRVPAEFVERAELPLVVDPVIATFALDSGPPTRRNPDAAFDRGQNRWLVCLEEVVSGSDTDVLTRLYDVAGNVVAGSDQYLDLTTDAWTQPRVADVARDDAFVVVAQRGPAPFQIQGRVRTASSLSPKFTVSDSVAAPNTSPDAGGDPFEAAGPSFACVVWLKGGTTTYRLVDGAGTPQGVAATTIGVGIDDERPVVSESNGHANWNIAFGCCAPARQVYGARVSWDGILTAGPFVVELGFADFGNAAVSSSLPGTSKFAFAFSVGIPGTSTGTRLELYDNSTFLTSLTISGVMASSRTYAIEAHTPASFALVTSEPQSGGATFDVLLREITVSGSTWSQTAGPIELAATANADTGPRISSMNPTGAPAWRSFVAWTRDAVDAHAAIYDGSSAGTIAPYCFGDGSGTSCPCANHSPAGDQSGCLNSFGTAGKLVASGAPNVSFDSVTLAVTGLPTSAGQQPTFFQGTIATASGLGAVFGDGLRCASGTQIRLGTVAAQNGAAAFGFGAGTELVSVRGAVPAAGATRFYQLSYRNSIAFCTSATFNLSNGVQIVWVP